MRFRVLLIILGFAALSLSPAVDARITGGTRVTVSNVTHSTVDVSASITTDAAESGSYTLRFFLRAPGASTGVFVSAAPSTVPVNGNATTVFNGTLRGLRCGENYEVTGAYTDPEGKSYTITPSPSYTPFSSLPCAALTPATVSAKVFVGSAISPITLTPSNFNGTPSFQVNPSLPVGLMLDPTSGRVSGIPAVAKPATTYTITANGVISGTASAAFSLTVAPTLSDLEVLRYVASQPDLIDIFGTDITRARQHYLDWGFNEGRKITFEPLNYTASHPDLIEAFGLDEMKSVSHYIRWGYKERRQTTFTDLQALRYIASHPDLIEALGPDSIKGVRHYIQWGFREGRPITFDPLPYTASHFDLIDAFGVDERQATIHYIQWGYKEKRQVTFRAIDALNYIASSFDLIAALGADIVAGTRHYVQWGFKEGRQIVFDALTYIASHFDLISAFGADAVAGATHYINWGFKEGRRVTFDALGYLAAHFDLRAAFGNDTAAATQHYINWGFKEGRSFLWTVSANAGPGGRVSATRSYVKTNERVSLTITPDAAYEIDAVTGCGGSLSGTNYTTGPIVGTCAVRAEFKLKTISGALAVNCIGANCAAINSTTYAGTGIGVWGYNNSSTTLPALLNIELNGVTSGNTVTLLFSNGTKQTAPTTPVVGVLAAAAANASGSLSPSELFASSTEPSVDPRDVAHLQTLELNRRIVAELQTMRKYEAGKGAHQEPAALSQISAAPIVGSQRAWKDAFGGTTVEYPTSARAVCTAESGRAIVFWVDDQSWNSSKVTDSIIAKFKTAYCGASGGYERLVKLYGEPWGSHSYSVLISDSPSKQDLNVVMVPSKEGYGGYFWSLNAFDTDDQRSNKALAFFINVSGFSGDNTPSSTVNYYISTLVHEMMHMVNFYQRNVRRGSSHATWLEETSAMMSEDIVTPTVVSGYNKIVTERIPNYMQTGGDVSYINWSQLSRNNYAIGGTFGSFMNRRYGLSFFKALQTCGSDSYACVDSFVNLNGGGNFANEFARMGASIFSLLSGANLPANYGFPSRVEGEYTLSAVDIASLSRMRPNSGSTLSSGFRATSQTFIEDSVGPGRSSYTRNGVLVPAGTSITVIVR
jgi:hypothetical protein